MAVPNWRIGLVLVAAVAVALGCGKKPQPDGSVTAPPGVEDEEFTESIPWTPTPGQKPANVLNFRVAYLPATHDSLLFVALDQKLFDHYGLNVDAKSFPNSPAALDVLQAGEVDLAIPGIAAPIYRIGGGADLQIVGGEAWYSAAVVASSEMAAAAAGKKPAEVLAGLEGKTVGTVVASTGDSILRAAINRAGLDGRISIKEYKAPPHLVQAVKAREVDAAMLWSPHMSRAVDDSKGALRILLWTSQLQDHPCCRQIVTGTGVAGKREEITRYLCGIVAAKRFMLDLDNKEQVVAAVKRYDPATPEAVIRKELYRVARSSGVGHRYTEVAPGMSRPGVTNYLDMMKDAKQITQATKEKVLKDHFKAELLATAYRRVYPGLTEQQAAELADGGMDVPPYLRDQKPRLGQ